ncbi:MAG: hypothetical protein K9G62_08755 [Alphaproteobacteria bacterium]|nr:hypothetical protein [Alphaproteobacteria bacterium]
MNEKKYVNEGAVEIFDIGTEAYTDNLCACSALIVKGEKIGFSHVKPRMSSIFLAEEIRSAFGKNIPDFEYVVGVDYETNKAHPNADTEGIIVSAAERLGVNARRVGQVKNARDIVSSNFPGYIKP